MNWKARFTAAGVHLGISLLLALGTAALVFELWYPYPYRILSGGRDLFMLVVSVDVVLGPLLTFGVFNLKKARKVLARDLAVIGIVQLAALGYGLHTVYVARPVHMVFEINRLRVVHAVDIPADSLKLAPANLQALPLTGPTLVAVRAFKDNNEMTDATLAALDGVPIAVRPEFWQPYDAGERQKAIAISQPVAQLLKKYPEQKDALAKIAEKAQLPEAALRYLPLQSRTLVWSAILQPQTGDILGYLPVDGF